MIRPTSLLCLAVVAIAGAIPSGATARMLPLASAGCTTVSAAPSGSFDRQLTVAGEERSYLLLVPRRRVGEPLPLIVDLHGSGIGPETELAITGMGRAARARGLIVAAPRAARPFATGGFTWNVPADAAHPDDTAFVEALVDAVAEAHCIDLARVYAVGFSGGARLASHLACADPGRWTAIGAVGGLRMPRARCAGSGEPVAVIAVHGLADPVNPYDARPGESPPYWTYGIDEAFDRWLERNGCVGSEEISTGEGMALRRGDCSASGAVALYRLANAGHVWPGSNFEFPARLGAANSAIDATDVILDFFEAAADE